MTLRNISLLFVFLGGVLTAPALVADESAVVFMYHRFGEQQYPQTNIRVDQFRKQMDHLRDGGFTVIPLAKLVAFLTDNEPLPPKAVVLTIDDAWRSVYEVAYPLLSEYGFPFTVFVSTDPLDNSLPGYLSWDQAREMAANGVSFANHGAGHISMVVYLAGESETAWQQRIVDDIEKGARRLSEELPAGGQSLKHVFAYPYGEYNTRAAGQVAKLGYIAFGQQSGAVGRLSDLRALPRFPMAESIAGMGGFRTKAASLPLPVTRVDPWDPVTADLLPEISVTLADTEARLGELACFVSGQSRVEVQWIEQNRRFTVRPRHELEAGRHRVNCTAPGNDDRYLWFSHQWIVR
jgi:peptidoglycan/xylan/chitin deacetylase (PgdA/CDA1 family)